MKKVTNNFSYVSPSMEILLINCEQSFLAGSNFSFGGVDNEEFGDGGSFSDWK